MPFVTVAVVELVPTTDANVALLLVQIPPAAAAVTFILQFGVALDTAKDVVGDTTPKPVAVGNPLTVTIAVRLHVFVHVYVTVDVPAATPDTVPLAEPTVAFAGVLLNHVPPVVPVLANVVAAPVHTVSVPDIAVGNAITVTSDVLRQPVVVR